MPTSPPTFWVTLHGHLAGELLSVTYDVPQGALRLTCDGLIVDGSLDAEVRALVDGVVEVKVQELASGDALVFDARLVDVAQKGDHLTARLDRLAALRCDELLGWLRPGERPAEKEPERSLQHPAEFARGASAA
jgi:hypothetical protein